MVQYLLEAHCVTYTIETIKHIREIYRDFSVNEVYFNKKKQD